MQQSAASESGIVCKSAKYSRFAMKTIVCMKVENEARFETIPAQLTMSARGSHPYSLSHRKPPEGAPEMHLPKRCLSMRGLPRSRSGDYLIYADLFRAILPE